MQYSDIVQEHFEHPRNVGVIDNADAEAFVSNPACGDTMHLYLRIHDNRIVEAKFKTMGCPAAIAASSMTTEMLIGRTVEESLQLTRQEVSQALGGLTPQKVHCSVLTEDAIKAAIASFRKKGGGAKS
jgi:nitrogen fixation NifU-like protein